MREMFRLLLLGTIVFDDILLCMKEKVGEEYNMKNEDTQDFFENFILIFKHPVGGSKFETVHALFFQIIRILHKNHRVTFFKM